MAMTASISSLHKILKDETRRNILATVNSHGSLTYTDLLNQMDLSTGLLNYHLKVLGGLLAKNDAGEYMLSDKGKLAVKLTSEFPAENQMHRRKIWQTRFIIAVAVSQAAYFAVALVFFFLGYIDLYRLTTATIAVIMGTILVYFMWKMRWDTYPSQGSPQMQRRIKIAYVAGGISGGILLAFLGGGVLLHLISDIQGIPFTVGNPLYHLFWSTPYLIFSMIIAPILGAYIGYYAGKKRGFEQPKWAIWLNTHIGY
jgi:DNA-binding transcriptional ArsR family regulator